MPRRILPVLYRPWNDSRKSSSHTSIPSRFQVQFAVKHGFGGIMIFSLNADDPFGKCSNDGSESGDPSDSFPLSQVAIATLKDSLRIP